MKLTLAIFAELAVWTACFLLLPIVWFFFGGWSGVAGAAIVGWLASTVGLVAAGALGETISPDKRRHAFTLAIIVVLSLGDMALSIALAAPFEWEVFWSRAGAVLAVLVNARSGVTFRKAVA
jgi:hypothetical protein